MNDYSDKQVEELCEWMPALMAYLRIRCDRNDADAKALFDHLDTYCWHQPPCVPGVVCEGGKPRRPVAEPPNPEPESDLPAWMERKR